MTPEQKSINDKLDNLSAEVSRLASYLNSDPATNRPGIVETLDRLDKTVNELLTRERVYKAKATTFGTIGGAMVMVGWNIIKFFAAK